MKSAIPPNEENNEWFYSFRCDVCWPDHVRAEIGCGPEGYFPDGWADLGENRVACPQCVKIIEEGEDEGEEADLLRLKGEELSELAERTKKDVEAIAGEGIRWVLLICTDEGQMCSLTDKPAHVMSGVMSTYAEQVRREAGVEELHRQQLQREREEDPNVN